MKIDTDKLKAGIEDCLNSFGPHTVSNGFTLGDVRGCRIVMTIYSEDMAEEENIPSPHKKFECITE